MKPTVYIETSVPGSLKAWPSRDLIRAARQQMTREWWARRDEFDLFTSRLVVQECQAGDAQAAADRLSALAGIPLLEQEAEAAELAEALLRDVPLPAKAAANALHIATAAVHGMQYLLLTWNCTHMANVVLRPQIEAVCRAAGFEPPLICTPKNWHRRARAMTDDVVLREIRGTREAFAQSHHFDIRAMVAELRVRDAVGDWRVVRHAPRRPAPVTDEESRAADSAHRI